MNALSHAILIRRRQLALPDIPLTHKLQNVYKSLAMPCCQSGGLMSGWRHTQKRSSRKRQRQQPQRFVFWVLSGPIASMAARKTLELSRLW